jgi:hypothetical protein
MKRTVVLFFLFCISYTEKLYCQEVISLLDGRVTFEMLSNDNVIRFQVKWDASMIGKIEILPTVTGEDFFRGAELDSFSPGIEQLVRLNRTSNRQITNNDLLNVLRTRQPFALIRYDEMYLRQSYSVIHYEGGIIGETFFFANPLGTSWPSGLGYLIVIVVENVIIKINIGFVDAYNIVPRELPEYVIERNGEYYWKDNDARNRFYQQMNTDINRMPEQIQLLRETYNLIMNTLRIN